jgi:hypothetical protein
MIPIVLALAVAGSTGYPTNLEMAEQVVTESVTSLADSLGDAGIDDVSLEVVGEHAGNWLVEQSARAVLSDHGVSVAAADRTGGGMPVLRLRAMDLAVTLGNAGRSWLFGSKHVDRIARCELAAELLDSEGVTQRSWRCGSFAEDRVPYSELTVLQGSSGEEWITGGTPTSSGGGILEPLVVTGVVASLIYLFYSSRAE